MLEKNRLANEIAALELKLVSMLREEWLRSRAGVYKSIEKERMRLFLSLCDKFDINGKQIKGEENVTFIGIDILCRHINSLYIKLFQTDGSESCRKLLHRNQDANFKIPNGFGNGLSPA